MKSREKLELYVHIPFCARKCEYCDFLSGVAPEGVHRQYTDKLIEEIQLQSARYRDYMVSTIFIGGGTPSILRAEYMEAVMDAIRQGFEVEEDAEITIEVNPGTVDSLKLDAYRRAGINRISLGLQSADNDELKSLGRIHTYEAFLKSYQRVRIAGFTNVNVDLMSALPGQTCASWEKTLKKVLMLKPEHISAYSLIIEEGTPFYTYYGPKANPLEYNRCPLPDEELERWMYYKTKEILKQHGYERYEISNYAKPGYECRHNIGYWTGVEYLGLGLGSSSYIKGERFCNESDLKTYLDRCSDEENLRQELEILSLQEKMEEFMFLGLRMMDGVSGSEFVGRFGQNMWNVYKDVIEKLAEQGLLEIKSPSIRLTEKGIDVSNYVLSQFLLD